MSMGPRNSSQVTSEQEEVGKAFGQMYNDIYNLSMETTDIISRGKNLDCGFVLRGTIRIMDLVLDLTQI